MKKIGSKSGLAVILSQLKGFENPESELEQYQTESEIAAEIIWNAFYRREIEEMVVADLGAGTGILGIGALIMGAKKVFFVEKDGSALSICRENITFIEEKLGSDIMSRASFVVGDVSLFDEKVDVLLENPPFGIQSQKHADRVFLEKAMAVSPIIYSFHTVESKPLIEALSKDREFMIEGYWEFDWPLKKTMKFHKKKIQYIRVGCWRLEKHKR